MQENWKPVSGWLAVHEGGQVDHPKDPGGRTHRGVTQRVFDAYQDEINMPRRDVWTITHAEALRIYKQNYWDVIWGDKLPSGLDYTLYDFAVNSGPHRAVSFLQELLGVKVDGGMGPITFAAARGVNNLEQLITDLNYKRWNWMKTLSTFKTFGRGWTRRVMGEVAGAQPGSDTGVIDRSLMMAGGQVAHEMPDLVDVYEGGKAEEEDKKISAKVKEDLLKPEALLKGAGGAIPGTIGAVSMAPEGPIQWALAAALVIMAAGAVFIAYKLLTKRPAR